MTPFDVLMAGYYLTVDPLLVRLRKRPRLRDWPAGPHLPSRPLAMHAALAQGPGADQALRRFTRIARRYDMRAPGEADHAARRRAAPMMLDLAQCVDGAGFEALLRRHSRRTLPKIRQAQRQGYCVERFALPMHVHDVHAVKTSMALRSGGPVLARWLLKPHHVGTPARMPVAWQPPGCATHWTMWWGVFLPEPGHCNGALQTDRRLVAYLKLTRCGDVVHYLDLMGHKDHLGHGVMPLMHAAIVRWLLDAAEPCAAGVHAVWYGALEHGGPGLLTWKKRAGFEPVRVILQA
ncbi:hypothetical protein [Bordetella petrii]|uniref:Uncharacterized protein n=1 Tax=Bordetella petrii (strain ATCC BAA-461 / DSM 12804 / CCUG 43448 / CIP 107267 / Se-1111R) TaxID=340100 RepID=A9ILL8_BORPD|nr:hypothetical protein [Bordetella petrii]CAP42599.1 hypothetical protein predicted by Glimmer/Critica [Bordetella petrii]